MNNGNLLSDINERFTSLTRRSGRCNSPAAVHVLSIESLSDYRIEKKCNDILKVNVIIHYLLLNYNGERRIIIGCMALVTGYPSEATQTELYEKRLTKIMDRFIKCEYRGHNSDRSSNINEQSCICLVDRLYCCPSDPLFNHNLFNHNHRRSRCSTFELQRPKFSYSR